MPRSSALGPVGSADRPPAPSPSARALVADRVRRGLSLLPGFGLAPIPVRVAKAGFAMARRRRHSPIYPALPAARPTPGVLANIAVDELALGIFRTPRREPRPDDYPDFAAHVGDAHAHYSALGHIADPLAHHPTPPPLHGEPQEPGHVHGVAMKRLSWSSGFRVDEGAPGGDTWPVVGRNATASAIIVEHPDGGADRPWLVCIHGLGTGRAMQDLFCFRAKHLQRDLGLNLAFPVLPLHGPRGDSAMHGTEFLSSDLVASVHGVSQAVWDLRRLLGWIRGRSDGAIGLHGVSLGGYLTSLLGSMEPDLAAVIAGVPLTDIPALFASHAPARVRRIADRYGMLGQAPHELHRMISPLAMQPLVPHDRRFIYAGLADRLTTPVQGHRLWMHWQRPEALWFRGGHLGFLWSREVQAFVDGALTESGLVGHNAPILRAQTG